jgi:preprotein translocase subunit SecB
MTNEGEVRIFDSLQIEDVLLHGCSFHLDEGDRSAPGTVNFDANFEADPVDGEDLVRIVYSMSARMLDQNEGVIATAAVSYAISYRTNEGLRPTADELETYALRAGVFQVHPYFRQYIATTTASAGLPLLMLPVLIVDHDDG